VSETFTCPVTEPVIDQPPDDPNADPFGEGQYFINENRTIWVGLPWGGWKTGGEKVIWIRPAGTELTINGRLLDQEDGPPLEASIPCCYVTGFQVAGIYFPVPGCWEITAEAGPERLQFVTEVGFGSTVIKGLILLDYQLNSEILSPGTALTLTLNWQGGVAAADDMVIFFHLLDAEGSLVAQFDQPLPAETWTAQNITTTHSLVIPEQPGTYSLAVGLYESDTNTRIPFYSKDELAADGIITLTTTIEIASE
jgi:hypothetical protein